jgi:hypothetical protein
MECVTNTIYVLPHDVEEIMKIKVPTYEIVA